MKLEGKVALVTGGGRGIGRAIALAFAAEGADLALLARTKSQVESVADEVRSLGRQSLALCCDVTDHEAVLACVNQSAENLSRLDIVVNNAGGGQERTRVGDDDPTQWKEVVEVNLMGTYYGCRAAIPHLARQGGHIINVGSGMGHQSRVGNSSYNAAKAGVWMLTRCLAMELWEQSILVNELIPGPVHTELTDGIFEAGLPHPNIPAEWVKRPDEVTDLALFLATQPPTGPTGQSFSLARRPMS